MNDYDLNMLYRKYPELPKDYRTGCPTCHKSNGDGKDGVIRLVKGGEEIQCNCQDQLSRAKHYLNAGIGDIYQRLRFEDYVGGDKNALDNVQAYMKEREAFIDRGIGMCISGSNGNGKTMLLMLTMKFLVREGYKCYATTFADLLTMIKGGWHSDEDRNEYKRKIDAAHILMIDDVGKEQEQSSSGFAIMTFGNILRERLQNSRPTFITTNFSWEEFTKVYGESTASLLRERSVMLTMTGNDYREDMRNTLLDDVKNGVSRRIY